MTLGRAFANFPPVADAGQGSGADLTASRPRLQVSGSGLRPRRDGMRVGVNVDAWREQGGSSLASPATVTPRALLRN